MHYYVLNFLHIESYGLQNYVKDLHLDVAQDFKSSLFYDVDVHLPVLLVHLESVALQIRYSRFDWPSHFGKLHAAPSAKRSIQKPVLLV